MQLVLFAPSSLTFHWAFPRASTCLKNTCSSKFASTVWRLTSSFDTREDAKHLHDRCFCNFCKLHGVLQSLSSLLPHVFEDFLTLQSNLGLRIWCGRRRSFFSSLTTFQVSSYQSVMTETTWVSFWTLSMCLPLKTLSHFPLNVGFLSFLTLCDCSSFHNLVPNPEVSSSHHLINMKWMQSLKSCKSLKWDQGRNPFVTICRKVIWSSVKNQVALSTRWATWSCWHTPRRLFSVLLAWSTYQRDWTCVNAASGFDPIKVRWTESEQHLQR